MSVNKRPAEHSGKSEPKVDFESFARALGRGLSQMSLYGVKHAVTQAAIDTCFKQILAACTVADEIILSWPEKDLVINGKLVSQKNSLVQALVAKLLSAEIMGLSFSAGLTRDEFSSLLQILSDSAEGQRPSDIGLDEALKQTGIVHVKVREIKYAAVEEGQVVVGEDDVGAGSDNEKAALGLLDSKDDVLDANGTRALEKAVKNPSRLSDIIVKSAEDDRASGNVEQMASRILTNLKRGCDALLDGEDARTAKGKRALSQNLNRLEKELLDRSPETIPESCSADISSTIGRAVDTLMTESMVDDYAHNRDALRENEKRLIRFLRSKQDGELDLDAVRQQAVAMGLSNAEMQSILRQGGFEGSSDALTSGSALAGLMERVEGAVPGAAGQDFDQVRMLSILREVESQVGVLMQATDSKIHGLEEKLASLKSAEKDAAPADNEETMRVLAEITQELCQPLSVVNCSVDMVKAQRLGPLEQSQADMLDLASTSGQRLLTLINKLGEITGMPSTLNPQEDILSEIYK
ncbi:MAG: hypothetical protein OSB41_06100 [Kiritimatiellae bacterium]|nr:hypothetical protein [Kiritimatiellia bacterium]